MDKKVIHTDTIYIYIDVLSIGRECQLIKSNLSRILGEKKLKIADVVRGSGLSRKAVNSLYQGDSLRVDFETLDKLCAYLSCNVGDIVEYVPGPAKQKN
jgi:putative transcriptional regulator